MSGEMIHPSDPDDEAQSDEQLAELDAEMLAEGGRHPFTGSPFVYLDPYLDPLDDMEPSDEQLAEDLGIELPED
jgi:hypothetical protein